MPTNDFDTSKLTGEALRIADAVIAMITQDKGGEAPYGGGGCAFYTPEAWRERGEEYGCNAVLILVHDGGDLAMYCNYDYGAYKAIDRLADKLRAMGYYAEQCTSWYTAIYSDQPKPQANEPVVEPNDEIVAVLARDLSVARAAAVQAVSGMKDGGTCCMDDVKVQKMPAGASDADLQAAVQALTVKGQPLSAFGRSLGPPTNAQGYPRTKACEVLSAALNAAGWQTSVQYVMD